MRHWGSRRRSWLALLVTAGLLTGLLVAPGMVGAGAERYFIRGTPEALAAAEKVVAIKNRFPNSFSAIVTAAQLSRLQQIPGIALEPVGTVYVLGGPERSARPSARPGGGRALPEDPTPWGIESTWNSQTISSTGGGAGVIVAVLDTGVASHVDLKAPLQCKDWASARTGYRNNSCADKNGHGTHVTGTILANGGSDGKGIWGVAPGADYFAYKVLGNGGSGSWDDVASAIREAADNGANIISMSLGGSSAPEELRQAIQYANSRNVLVIAAAGNSGPGVDTIGYPAAFAEVVAVAALEMVNGTTGDGDSTSLSNLRVTDFSSRGRSDSDGSDGIQDREVEVSGPGRYVESTASDGTYVKYSGTSMATPHIAGLAALLWTGNHTTTRSALVSRAQQYDISQANGGGAGTNYDLASGYGQSRR